MNDVVKNINAKIKLNLFIENEFNFGVILCILIFNFIFFSCYRKCDNSMSIAAGDMEKNTTLQVTIDDSIKRKFYSPRYHFCIIDQDVLIKNYCTDKSEIKIVATIGNRDTIFFANPSDVSKVYIGLNPQNKYQSFLVNFIYQDNYQGVRKNEVIFEDPY